MLVVVPSRGRPGNIADLMTSWYETEANATLLVAVDDDDPQLQGYRNVFSDAHDDRYQLVVGPRLRLAGTLNSVIMSRVMRAGTVPYDIVGFMGDDHRPRTPHWDATVEDVVKQFGTSVIYGNDLIQGPNLPTAVFMTVDVVKTLGYFVPPGLVHMYLDNTWKAWGEAMGRLFYCNDVVIEHMHPIAGKSEWDDLYKEVNSGTQYETDQIAFKSYVAGHLHDDAEKLRSLING
jgi:hypothetical protein